MSKKELRIETIVTLPDGSVEGMAVSINEELYASSEIPALIHDVMQRGARAISQKLHNHKNQEK